MWSEGEDYGGLGRRRAGGFGFAMMRGRRTAVDASLLAGVPHKGMADRHTGSHIPGKTKGTFYFMETNHRLRVAG